MVHDLFCCFLQQEGRTGELPVKASKKARRVEERTVFLIFHENRVTLPSTAGTGRPKAMEAIAPAV